MLADTTNDDNLFPMVTAFGAVASGSMRRVDPVLPAPLQDRIPDLMATAGNRFEDFAFGEVGHG